MLESSGMSEEFYGKSQKDNSPPYLTRERITEIGITLITASRQAAGKSHHHKYKVGSSVYYEASNGEKKRVSYANKIPGPVKRQGYTSYDSIGEGNPTVHGEFRVLYRAPESEHLFLGCNTPLCANCLKSAIMREVDAIFLDVHSLPGFKAEDDEVNPWTKDRADLWNDLCLPLARAAGIPIYAINPETKKLSIIVSGIPPKDRPKPQFPARILTKTEINDPSNSPDDFLKQTDGIRRAIAVAKSKVSGEEFFIYTQDSFPPGFDEDEGKKMTDKFAGAHTRFHFQLDPVIHLAMEASKHGMELMDGNVFTNYIPSSGRQLDLTYIGIAHILYTENHIPATKDALDAKSTLSDMQVISFHQVPQNENVLQKLSADLIRKDIEKPEPTITST